VHEPLRPNDPRRLGRYELIGRLGQGGQGIVYLGRDESGREAAVKVLQFRPERHLDDRRRFEREVRALQRLNERCTAPILDYNLDAESPYLVSEYVNGPSLRRHVAERGPLSSVDVVELAINTLAALRAVHAADVVHRDISPHNILLGPDGPRLIDFGVAKVLSGSDSTTLELMANQAFMSPEHSRRDEYIGHSSDIYSWALTMLYAAGGYEPTPRPRDRILKLDAVPDSLSVLLKECLAEERTDRPSADALCQRMVESGMTVAHGVPDDWTTEHLTPGVPNDKTRTAPTVVGDPVWYLRWWVPYAGAPLVTGGLCTVYVGLFHEPFERVLPASAGLLVALFLLFAIAIDPARHEVVSYGDERPPKPTHPRSLSD
jgi:serine/threonine protein kinase